MTDGEVGGVAETMRRHSADCRAQEAHREHEAHQLKLVTLMDALGTQTAEIDSSRIDSTRPGGGIDVGRAICQRCRESKFTWTIQQAEIHIGELRHWRLQLCERCTAQAQRIIHSALEPLSPVAREASTADRAIAGTPECDLRE